MGGRQGLVERTLRMGDTSECVLRELLSLTRMHEIDPEFLAVEEDHEAPAIHAIPADAAGLERKSDVAIHAGTARDG